MSKPSDEYLTPPNIAAAVEQYHFGPVDFDPYASPGQFVPARMGRTIKEKDGQFPEGVKTVWCNPPFSESKTIVPEISRLSFERGFDLMLLIQAAPGSVYWRKGIWDAPHMRAVSWLKRPTFWQLNDQGVPEKPPGTFKGGDCALIFFSPSTDSFEIEGKLGRFKTAFAEVSRCIIRASKV